MALGQKMDAVGIEPTTFPNYSRVQACEGEIIPLDQAPNNFPMRYVIISISQS
jgi:hypothetical protein